MHPERKFVPVTLHRKLIAFVSLPLALIILTPQASVAQTLESQAAFPHQGKSPYAVTDGSTCAGDAQSYASVEIKRGGVSYGTVDLRLSYDCLSMWARVTLKSTLGANYYANAYVKAYNNALNEVGRFNCDSANGNGHVITGQSTCYTPMWEWTYLGMEGSKAEGYIYHKNTSGVWEIFAFGQTLVNPI
jgi:hypothetical protein